MTKFNTGNQVGSADPRDLYDNAVLADNLVSGTAEAYPDRIGKSRKSWAGVEAQAATQENEFNAAQQSRATTFTNFLNSSGFEYLGAYAAGIQFTEYNQYVVDGGEAWFISPSTALPYTTVGTGVPEGGALMSRGEALLRQEIGGGVRRADTLASLKAFSGRFDGDAARLMGRTVAGDGGEGDFRWDGSDLSAEVSADTLSSIYVPPSTDDTGASGAWVRSGAPEFYASWFSGSSSDFNAGLSGAEGVSSQGQKLRLPDHTLTLSDGYTERLQLIGNSKASILKAGVGASQVIDFGQHAVDWDFHEITNVTFDGNIKSSNGARFNNSGENPELGGRWTFQACRFTACDKGAYQATGNIGNRYKDCNFNGNDYGLFLQNAPAGIMHAGAVLVEGCEFNSNAIAAIYGNDSQDGLGAYAIRDTVIEGNPGFGVFLDLNSVSPFTGVVLDHVWFEANATSPSVTVEGVAYAPRDLYLKNAKPVRATGVNLKNVELVNATLIGHGCRLDDATGACEIVLDSESAMILHDVYADGQPSRVPMVQSIARQRAETGLTGSRGFRGPLRTHRAPANGAAVYANTFEGVGPWTFSGTASVNAVSVADGVIGDTGAELTIPDGYTLLGPDKGTPTPGKWAVFGIHAKLVSGAAPSVADLGGGGSAFTRLAIDANRWACTYGVAKVGATVAESRLRFINNTGGPITVRFADMFVVEFDTEAEALEFANSRAAPK